MALMETSSKRPDWFPPGLSFSPSKEELIQYYLKKKMEMGTHFSPPFIREADVYSLQPHHLTEKFWDGDNKEWYFFYNRNSSKSSDHKGPADGNTKKKRVSRTVCDGSTWRETQKTKQIRDGNGTVIGSKRSFEYMEKKPGVKKAEKSLWLMEEFSAATTNFLFGQGEGLVEESSTKLDRWVMYKIYPTPRALSKPPSCECNSSSCLQTKQRTCNSCITEADGGASVVDEATTVVSMTKKRKLESVEVSDLSTSCNKNIVPFADVGHVQESAVSSMDNQQSEEYLLMFMNDLPQLEVSHLSSSCNKTIVPLADVRHVQESAVSSMDYQQSEKDLLMFMMNDLQPIEDVPPLHLQESALPTMDYQQSEEDHLMMFMKDLPSIEDVPPVYLQDQQTN